MNIREKIAPLKNKIIDYIEQVKSRFNKVKYKVERRLSNYYTYDELVLLISNKTGMYEEFDRNWNNSEKPSLEDYYKHLIKILPFEAKFNIKPADIYKNGRKMRNPIDITESNFIKKDVNLFLKEQKKTQDSGRQPSLINFYKGKSIYDMHRLSIGSRVISSDYYEDQMMKFSEEEHRREYSVEDINEWLNKMETKDSEEIKLDNE